MRKKLVVCFDSTWVLSKRNDDKLPVEAFAAAVTEDPSFKVVGKSLVECTVETPNVSDDTLVSLVAMLMKQTYPNEDVSLVYTVQISAVKEAAPADKKEDQPKKKETEESKPVSSDSLDDAIFDFFGDDDDNDDDSAAAASERQKQSVYHILKKIDSLVGAEEFKALAHECVKVAPGLIKHNMTEVFIKQCYIFAINDGYGLTTYLELFAELLEGLKLVTFGRRKIVEERLSPPNPKESSISVSNINRHLHRHGKSEGMLICIDISEWMTKYNDKKFREFLSELDDANGNCVLVFRIPFVEKDILANMKKAISDRLTVRNISFIPFDIEELKACAQESLEKTGYTMTDDAWEVFTTRLAEEKSDGRFYGINTVNKIIREMIYIKQLSNAGTDVDDSLVKKEEIMDLAVTYRQAEQTGLDILDEMVGMETIKQRVQEIVVQIETSLKNRSLGSPCIHMRFVGNPGTGKTTVARVLGRVLKERGVLRNGSFFEYAGRDFCGQYVGETAPKTAAMCRDAYGSVMFIDEAYSLYRGNRSTVDYGREAIDTLIAEMENHRSDLVVIMAGYPAEMAQLMQANPGLESRMPYVIEFPNYTNEQLTKIFMSMVKKSFAYQDGFEEAVQQYFMGLPQEVVNAREFSNARFVRNLFERTWCKSVLRAQLNKEEQILLTKEDFLQASSEKEFKFMMEKRQRTLGFV